VFLGARRPQAAEQPTPDSGLLYVAAAACKRHFPHPPLRDKGDMKRIWSANLDERYPPWDLDVARNED
jgi:hypothetical protein